MLLLPVPMNSLPVSDEYEVAWQREAPSTHLRLMCHLPSREEEAKLLDGLDCGVQG